jgi:glycosyltransferase involved in cell wall biosynthesis
VSIGIAATPGRRARVVLATDSSNPSGVGEHMLTLGQELRGGYDVLLAFPGEARPLFDRAASAGLAAQPLAVAVPEDGLFRMSLLHVHAGIGWEGHELVRAGRRAGVPVVRSEHLPYLLTDERQRAEHRQAVLLADRLVTVSQASAESYRDAGIPAGRIRVVRNGIHFRPPARSRARTRRALGLGVRDTLLLTVARFTGQKDHMTLIRAVSLLAAANSSIRLLLVGSGPSEQEVWQAVEHAGLQRRVRFLGQRSDVPDLLAASDLFVLPSRFEGLPLVILEAMAAGLPVAATRIGGVIEALGDDYPFLAEAGDAAAMAAAIAALIARPSALKSARDRNRRRFEAGFQARRMGEDMCRVYEELAVAACPEQETIDG